MIRAVRTAPSSHESPCCEGSTTANSWAASITVTQTDTTCQVIRLVASDTPARMPGPVARAETAPKAARISATGSGNRRRRWAIGKAADPSTRSTQNKGRDVVHWAAATVAQAAALMTRASTIRQASDRRESVGSDGTDRRGSVGSLGVAAIRPG